MIIKVIADTNVILKGMFGYKSVERKILSLSLAKKIYIYGSNETYQEFCQKVKIPRLQRYWVKKNFSPDKIILDYKTIVNMHEPVGEAATVEIPIRDPKDAIFIRVAMSVGAKIIISEDKDLLDMKKVGDIKIVNAEKFIEAYFKLYPQGLVA